MTTKNSNVCNKAFPLLGYPYDSLQNQKFTSGGGSVIGRWFGGREKQRIWGNVVLKINSVAKRDYDFLDFFYIVVIFTKQKVFK